MTKALPDLHVGSGWSAGALTVFPVWIDAPRVTGLEWRGEALAVGELSGGARVGRLQAHSRSARPVVGLEGDLVSGGMQNRMLATSRVFAPHESCDLDALCVERGRWNGVGGHRAEGRTSAYRVRHASVRGRSVGELHGTQHEVWNRIERFERDLGASPTSSLQAHLDRAPGRLLRDRPLEGQRGVIIGIGGRVMAAELFGSTTGLAARWRGILDAASLDAQLAPAVVTRAETARSFARRMAEQRLLADGDGGLATRIRSERAGLRGSGLAFGSDAGLALDTFEFERLIHINIFDESHPLLEVAA